MKSTLKINHRNLLWFQQITLKSFILGIMLLPAILLNAQAQDTQYTKPSWWFGAAAAANFNFYQGSTQQVNSDLITSVAFHDGFGVGLYAAPLVEFYRPGSMWGMMLQAGYDGRNGKYNQVFSPCNCPRDLAVKLNYISFEPSLRFSPFRNNFYLYAGPRFAYNINKSFTYTLGTNPAYPEQIADPAIKGDFSKINPYLISMQIGTGYDIYLTPDDQKTQLIFSPFVAFQPYIGQDPRSVETWNITTLRAGASLKIGKGREIIKPEEAKKPEEVKKPEEAIIKETTNVVFTMNAPKNVEVIHRTRETFPVRNYVFFDEGSTAISERYVKIDKSQVKDFSEDRLEVFTPKQLSGRSARQMTVYYNVLNILGDRMQKNPETTVRLTGASEEGIKDGLLMAESVKFYLMDVFEINSSRIITEGRLKPRSPSENQSSDQDLALRKACDRRVTIWSESPSLMMEFQSGPDAPLKPIKIITETQPVDSALIFHVAGADESLKSWSLEIKDGRGQILNYGPYTTEKIAIPNNEVLGTFNEGNYKVKMTGITKTGKTIRIDTTVHLVKWKEPKIEEGMRFSIIYDYDNAKAIQIYENYLTNIVLPQIPKGATVIVNGYTDVIGLDTYNQELSLARANDVKQILQAGLNKAGRNDVRFEFFGRGEDINLSPFENKMPEERFYNRTVIIDIQPTEIH